MGKLNKLINPSPLFCFFVKNKNNTAILMFF
jgi:hypothetical protein